MGIRCEGPSQGRQLVMPYTLDNSRVHSDLEKALFGRKDFPGYLSPLGMRINNVALIFKTGRRTIGVGETYGSIYPRQHSILRAAAEALRIEIFQCPWTTKIKRGENEAYLWKLVSPGFDDWERDTQALLTRLETPLFGGLPQLIGNMVGIAREAPSVVLEKGGLLDLLQHPQPENVARIINSLVALAAQPLPMDPQQRDAICSQIHHLKPRRKVMDREERIAEAQAFVLGEVIHQTKMVGAWTKKWFTSFNFDRFYNERYRKLLESLGYGEEWIPFQLAYREHFGTDRSVGG